MINYEEAVLQNHEKLNEYMKQIRSLEIKLTEAESQERDWRRIATQHRNDLDKVKLEARKLSHHLFGEEKLKGYPAE